MTQTKGMELQKKNEHVLIVDDTRKNIQVLGTILRGEGFQISIAQNGQQALGTVSRVQPDLILLDIRMPVMDGFETCRRLKADPESAAIPVIFLTAEASPDDVVMGFRLGAVDYVTKPFNSEELLSRVRTHLTIRRLQISLEQSVTELNKALQEIEHLHREQDAFLRHELGNAISPIIGYADLLLLKDGDSLADTSREWLKKIVVGSREMNDLLISLRQLQSIERGSHEMSLTELDLSRLLRDLVSEFRSSSPSGVVFDLQSAEGSEPIRADSALLPGVFRNLIKNAQEHIQDLPSEDERTVTISLDARLDSLSVSVRNRGPVVGSRRLASFFEKFNSTKKGSGGTGLGTSYVEQVVKAHRGSTEVSSTPEDGTCIVVNLPRSP